MIVGPVFWMEMRSAARRARHYFTRALIVSVVFAIVVSAWYAFQWERSITRGAYGIPTQTSPLLTPLAPYELAQLGHRIFSAYSLSQFVLIVFLAPLYTAGAVAGDRERGVLEMLFTTDLRNVELVASKFLVRTIHLCSLVAAGVPVMFLCLLLGGVSADSLMATMALTITTVVFVGSLGLLISIGSRRAVGAVILLYLTLLMVWVALPCVAGFVAYSGTVSIAGLGNALCMAIISLNPMVNLASVVANGWGAPPGIWIDSVWICVACNAGAALVLMIINAVVIRRLGLWASREQIVRDRKRDRKRRARRVWSNPVAWREVTTIAIHRRMRWARLLCLLFSFMISSVMWIGWIGDMLQGRRALSIDQNGTAQIIATTAAIAWILMALQGGVGFSHEREHSTMDALLTTPLAGARIFSGKLQGVWRNSAFALAFPVSFLVFAYSRDVTTFRGVVLSLAVIVVVGLWATCLGLACSIWFGSSGKATGLAGGIMLALCVGIPLACEVFGNRFSWHSSKFVSPSLNLAWAVRDERYGSDQLRGYISAWPYVTWSGRWFTSVSHLALELIVSAALVFLSIRYLETVCRTRQVRGWRRHAKAPAASIESRTSSPAAVVGSPPVPCNAVRVGHRRDDCEGASPNACDALRG
jgi:ABC-type transport system involved in multi-copper enzyme maturation permease subunit